MSEDARTTERGERRTDRAPNPIGGLVLTDRSEDAVGVRGPVATDVWGIGAAVGMRAGPDGQRVVVDEAVLVELQWRIEKSRREFCERRDRTNAVRADCSPSPVGRGDGVRVRRSVAAEGRSLATSRKTRTLIRRFAPPSPDGRREAKTIRSATHIRADMRRPARRQHASSATAASNTAIPTHVARSTRSRYS
jgi:hypothetical protein